MTLRLRGLLFAILGLLLMLGLRLTYLQLVQAEEYRLLSADNFLQEQRIAPLRGKILARDGTPLAENRVAVDLMYWGGEVENWQRLSYLLGLDEPLRPPDGGVPRERALGVALASNIPDHLIPAIEELVAGQRNLYLHERIERTYPTGLAAHVIGYTTEADPQRFPGYGLGELVGQMGLEASYQEVLFGGPGLAYAEVNNRRVVVKRRDVIAAQPGLDIILTLDTALQRSAEEILQNALEYLLAERRRVGRPAHDSTTKGALIALNPTTGEILAMASSPGFDQHLFTRRPPDNDSINALLADSIDIPLMNRAVNPFAPGSTFKLLTASALLENSRVTQATIYPCTTAYNFGGYIFRNWAPAFRGNYSIVQALADSCNTWFYQAADRAGWAEFAHEMFVRAVELGLGQPSGINLNEERPGLIPTDAWSREVAGHAWRPGDTINMSIGQGNVLVTPLQLAQMLATVVMEGKQVQPHLVKRIGDRELEVPVRQVPGRYWQVLVEGLENTVRPGGTAYHVLGSHRFPVPTGGKTGTAQAGSQPHSWYLAYGPVDNPEIVVVAFFQNAGEGSRVALPAVRDFLAFYWGVDE